jgi:WD40 repeat protein
MPGPGATKKNNKSKPAPHDAGFPEDEDLFDPNTIRAADKKRGRNAGSKKKDQSNGAEDIYADEVTRGLSTSPNGPPSMLGQIPYPFPRSNAHADVLDVLSDSVKVSDQYSARTDAWAQDVPYGKSPPGNPVVGESAEESPPVHGGYLGRGGFNGKTPPRSPAPKKTRPVSFSSTNTPGFARQQSEYGYRQSEHGYGSPPALPHLPQHHFYAAHDINFGLGHTLAKEDTQRTFMAFRELPAIAGRAGKGHNGIFVGSKDRLDILASTADGKYEHIGALVDLAGDVTEAMPLTWSGGDDPFINQRPLVAIAVHGKCVIQNPEFDTESIATGPPNGYNEITQSSYETRIEVYSLKEQAYITTLLRIPSQTWSSLTQGNLNPDPAGDLRLEAVGSHLIISSGFSGEVFVCGVPQPGKEAKLECLAKYWTTVQAHVQRRDSSHSRSPRTAMSDMSLDTHDHQAAIFSGNGRYLAICPPGSSHSHRPALSAVAAKTKRTKASLTIESRNPPGLPSTNCAVESTDVSTIFRTVTRGAAKQVVKGASWLGNQGMQAWNGYWNKDQQQQPPPPSYLYSPRQHPQAGLFPPTHALESISQEPEVVSIIDLNFLETAVTFECPKGCSFLSFTPDGLGLLTASKKGDVQYVWDLKQMKNAMVFSMRYLNEGSSTGSEMEREIPKVRQIARFDRLSPTTVVDVVWEPTMGERFALVSKKGTIHLFDLPLTAFRWPEERQMGTIRPATSPSVAAGESESTTAGSLLSSAINMASMAPTTIANLRGRAPSLGQGIAGVGATGIGIASATGMRGGRAVAAGLSKSLGAATGTMQNLRHTGENRLHIDAMAANPAPGMIAFSRRANKPIMLILDKGSVKSYHLTKASMRDKNNRLQMVSVFGKKGLSFRLPHIASLTSNNTARDGFQQEEEAQGFWPAEPRGSAAPNRLTPPLSHAENDSYALQQAFHADPRVDLLTYPDGQGQTGATAAWVFGGKVSATGILDGEE